MPGRTALAKSTELTPWFHYGQRLQNSFPGVLLFGLVLYQGLAPGLTLAKSTIDEFHGLTLANSESLSSAAWVYSG